MKQKLLKMTLLLCALIVGSNVWADETENITLSNGSFSTDHITWSGKSVTIQQMKGSSSTAVNSSYISAPRVYKGHILSFVAKTGYAIKSISITYTGSYYGNSMTAGTVVSENLVTDNTTDVSRTWGSTNNGTHVISSVSNEGLSAIYIQNVASSTNTQLRPTAISVTYITSGGGDTPTTYTVTYDANGGTGTMTDDDSPYEANAIVTVLGNEFTRDDYTFEKWNTAADGSGTDYNEDNTFTITANTTLYAQWTKNGSGNVVTLTQSNLELTGSYTTDTEKTIDGITYVYTDLMKNNDNIQAKASTGTIKNTTAYSGDIISVAITHSGTARATTINGSADGTNWTQIATGSGSITADFSGKGYRYFQITRGSNAAYWAKIEIIYSTGPTTYSVTYDGNGNTGGSVPTDANAYSSGDEVTVLENTEGLVKAGYIWTCWNTQADGNGNNYYAGNTFGITANTTLYAKWTPKTITALEYTGTPAKATYFSGESFDPTGLTVTATFNDSSSEDVTTSVVWTPNPLTTGTTSVTGTYMEQTITVEGITVTAAPGSAENPYTVAEAIAYINTLGSETSANDVYVSGIISQVDNYNSTYNSITYWISDDGTTTGQMEVYSGKGIDGAGFSAVTDLLIGDVVTVKGKVKMYNTTPEFIQNNVLVSFTRPAVTICADPVFSPEAGTYTSAQNVTISTTTDGATIYYTTDGSNPTTASTEYTEPISVSTTTTIKAIAVKDGLDNSSVVSATYTINLTPVINAENVNIAYDATSGEIAYIITNPTETTLSATTSAEWISNIAVTADKVTFTTTANDGDTDRTANVTLSYAGAEDKVITVTQAHYVVDYATLTFEFDGGRADIEATNGLSQEGLDSDYGSSPKLKFNSTDDWVILKFNERPGVLTFDIKGNSFSGGTFKVQTSEDGIDYTDLKSYTELGSTLNESFDNLGENVRYIKWIYTEKVNGNVALGNIALAAYSAPSLDPVITVDPDEVSVDADEHNGTLAITYANLTINDMRDFGVQFYDASNNELNGNDEPDWIEVLVAEQDPSIGEGYVVSYYMMENDGVERSAYLKVYALDDETNIVYSELITITQAAYVAPATGDQYALFSGNLVEGDYIIYYDGKAMNTTVSSDRLQYAEVTPNNDVITTNDASIVWHIAKSGDYWTIYNADADAYAAGTGAKNKAQMLEDGTDDKALWTITGTETYEFVNKQNTTNGVNANLRNNGTYGFACYATTTGGALSLYKKILPVTSTSLTLNAYGFATFASTEALDFSNYATADYSAWQITSVNTSTGVITFEQIKQTVAPGTGLLLKGTPSETITLNIQPEGGTTLSSNLLEGFPNGATINADEYYGLSGNKFVKVNGGTIPAGKALLPASEVSASVKAFTFVFEDDSDGINSLTPDFSEGEGAIYNLAGQRIDNSQFTIHNSQLKRGIYIVNGKKILK